MLFWKRKNLIGFRFFLFILVLIFHSTGLYNVRAMRLVVTGLTSFCSFNGCLWPRVCHVKIVTAHWEMGLLSRSTWTGISSIDFIRGGILLGSAGDIYKWGCHGVYCFDTKCISNENAPHPVIKLLTCLVVLDKATSLWRLMSNCLLTSQHKKISCLPRPISCYTLSPFKIRCCPLSPLRPVFEVRVLFSVGYKSKLLVVFIIIISNKNLCYWENVRMNYEL